MNKLFCNRWIWILAVVVYSSQSGQSQNIKLTGKPYIDMDYGPYLSASIEVSPGNIAYKGIAIRLDNGPGGISKGNEFVVFDTDTLRMAAAWSGEKFIDWRSIVYDGSHGTHPKLVGERLFTNPVSPGWAKPGTDNYKDPRLLGLDKKPYGPLPRDWGQWRGLGLHNNQVFLHYKIGGKHVIESPSLKKSNDIKALVRTFNLEGREEDLVLQIAKSEGKAQLKTVNGKLTAVFENGLIAGITTSANGAKFIAMDDGNLRLSIPAGDILGFNLVIAKTSGNKLGSFVKLLEELGEAENLVQKFQQGSARRWTESIKTKPRRLGKPGAFITEIITSPDNNPYRSWMRLGGFDFFEDDNRAAVCTWMGDVWIVEGINSTPQEFTWTRIATGMFQPLGLKIVEDKIYVTCRDQITLLEDINYDGEIDYYKAFNHDAQVTEHFHEFAMDLQTDAYGNFYYTKAARHAKTALVPQHGTLIKVTPDGESSEIIASGFRAPNGVCINPDGTYYVSDQEGHWTPKNEINLIEKGKFYGNLMGYHKGLTEANITSPMVWMHNDFDRSPAEQLWVDSKKWGGLGGQLINLSYGTGHVFVIMGEKVNGRSQGGLVRIPDFDFPTGVMRGRFHPGDGQLYACGLFGWAGNKTRPGGFYRLKHTGKPVHIPIAINALKGGVSLTFMHELDPETAADPESYLVKRWSYKRTRNYGSRDYKADGSQGRDNIEVTGVKMSADKKSVLLQIADMKPTMQMQIEYKIDTADGAYLSHRIQNTIHAIGNNGPFAKK
ncbi:MAG: DUF6797 domain-containing protein [Verrucomicrobiota bacterium]|nr:DUF6797 domain-containing protein [Verrucomicrobiota bacterium]